MVTKNQAMTLALVALAVTAVAVAATVYFILRVRGTGRIKLVGLKVYSDPELTKEVSAIDWGTLSPGDHGQVLLYLKVTSNVPTNLTLKTENWSPAAAENYLALTWDYDGALLAPGQVRATWFTLEVAETITGITDFAFDIVIIGAG